MRHYRPLFLILVLSGLSVPPATIANDEANESSDSLFTSDTGEDLDMDAEELVESVDSWVAGDFSACLRDVGDIDYCASFVCNLTGSGDLNESPDDCWIQTVPNEHQTSSCVTTGDAEINQNGINQKEDGIDNDGDGLIDEEDVGREYYQCSRLDRSNPYRRYFYYCPEGTYSSEKECLTSSD